VIGLQALLAIATLTSALVPLNLNALAVISALCRQEDTDSTTRSALANIATSCFGNQPDIEGISTKVHTTKPWYLLHHTYPQNHGLCVACNRSWARDVCHGMC
jgi:hypothetical protein